MPKIFNKDNLTFVKKDMPIPEFSWHISEYLSAIAKSEHMHLFVVSLDPDKYSYPYHSHRNAEELFVILSGKAMLRTPEGFQEVKQGDIIFFEKGPESAHQLHNHTDEPCKYLDICTNMGMDVCDYPDSGKVNIIPYGEIYKKDDAVGYFDGEENVKDKWKKE